MSKLLELLLGSLLVAVFSVAFLFFSSIHYILRAGGISDCTWQGAARAWIDSNADGLINADEPPLGGVEIYVEGIQNQWLDLSLPVITNPRGDVELNISLPGCSDSVFEIEVDIPEGYRITTAPRIQVQADLREGTREERVYYFGFVPTR